MKKIAIHYIAAIICLIHVSGCNNYLDVEPKGVQLLATTEDYDLWLNNSLLEGALAREMNLLGDNVDNLTIPNPPTSLNERVYTWADQFSPSLDVEPIIWQNHYRSINYYNTVLVGIDGATGNARQKASLKAEALLGRALEYFYLVNLYGKPYDAATAATDIAVPFVTSNDVTDPVPLPTTVQAIYDHIISDLTAALPDLPADNAVNRYRGSVAAGYSVFARVYFYMRNYTEAARYANLALESAGREVIDYNALAGVRNIPILVVRQDALYARISSIFTAIETPTLDFLRTFNVNDLRLKFFYGPANNNFTVRGQVRYYPAGFPSGSAQAYGNWGTSVAEMRLIVAEAAARNNDVSTALQQLEIVRKRRIATSAYQPYQLTDAEQVLQRVLAERAFEFPYHGLRWFDMRRLNKEGRMPAVERRNAAGTVISTLAPNSEKYTLQIPVQTRNFNPGWPQNSR